MTKAQWFAKLKSFVPSWVFSQAQSKNVAVFNGIAKIIASGQAVATFLYEQTFISLATGEYLDLHGAERSIFRLLNEPDDVYRERIRNIENPTAFSSLREKVAAILVTGEPALYENNACAFADDEFYCDDVPSVLMSKHYRYNHFTVVVPPQAIGDDTDIRRLIIEVLNKNKAKGILYSVVYGGTV